MITLLINMVINYCFHLPHTKLFLLYDFFVIFFKDLRDPRGLGTRVEKPGCLDGSWILTELERLEVGGLEAVVSHFDKFSLWKQFRLLRLFYRQVIEAYSRCYVFNYHINKVGTVRYNEVLSPKNIKIWPTQAIFHI